MKLSRTDSIASTASSVGSDIFSPLQQQAATTRVVAWWAVMWFICAGLAAALLLAAEAFQDYRPAFPLEPVCTTAAALHVVTALIVIRIGVVRWHPHFSVWQPFCGGITFVATQIIGYTFFSATLLTIYLYFAAPSVVPARTVLGTAGVLSGASSWILYMSIQYFGVEQPSKQQRNNKLKNEGHHHHHDPGQHHHLPSNETRTGLVLIAVEMIFTAVCQVAHEQYHDDVARAVGLVLLITHVGAAAVSHFMLGWRHDPDFRWFSPFYGSLRDIVSQGASWAAFSAAILGFRIMLEQQQSSSSSIIGGGGDVGGGGGGPSQTHTELLPPRGTGWGFFGALGVGANIGLLIQMRGRARRHVEAVRAQAALAAAASSSKTSRRDRRGGENVGGGGGGGGAGGGEDPPSATYFLARNSRFVLTLTSMLIALGSSLVADPTLAEWLTTATGSELHHWNTAVRILLRCSISFPAVTHITGVVLRAYNVRNPFASSLAGTEFVALQLGGWAAFTAALMFGIVTRVVAPQWTAALALLSQLLISASVWLLDRSSSTSSSSASDVLLHNGGNNKRRAGRRGGYGGGYGGGGGDNDPSSSTPAESDSNNDGDAAATKTPEKAGTGGQEEASSSSSLPSSPLREALARMPLRGIDELFNGVFLTALVGSTLSIILRAGCDLAMYMTMVASSAGTQTPPSPVTNRGRDDGSNEPELTLPVVVTASTILWAFSVPLLQLSIGGVSRPFQGPPLYASLQALGWASYLFILVVLSLVSVDLADANDTMLVNVKHHHHHHTLQFTSQAALMVIPMFLITTSAFFSGRMAPDDDNDESSGGAGGGEGASPDSSWFLLSSSSSLSPSSDQGRATPTTKHQSKQQHNHTNHSQSNHYPHHDANVEAAAVDQSCIDLAAAARAMSQDDLKVLKQHLLLVMTDTAAVPPKSSSSSSSSSSSLVKTTLQRFAHLCEVVVSEKKKKASSTSTATATTAQQQKTPPPLPFAAAPGTAAPASSSPSPSLAATSASAIMGQSIDRSRTSDVSGGDIAAMIVVVSCFAISSLALFVAADHMGRSAARPVHVAVLGSAAIAASAFGGIGAHAFFGPALHGRRAYSLWMPFQGGAAFVSWQVAGFGAMASSFLLFVVEIVRRRNAAAALLASVVVNGDDGNHSTATNHYSYPTSSSSSSSFTFSSSLVPSGLLSGLAPILVLCSTFTFDKSRTALDTPGSILYENAEAALCLVVLAASWLLSVTSELWLYDEWELATVPLLMGSFAALVATPVAAIALRKSAAQAKFRRSDAVDADDEEDAVDETTSSSLQQQQKKGGDNKSLLHHHHHHHHHRKEKASSSSIWSILIGAPLVVTEVLALFLCAAVPLFFLYGGYHIWNNYTGALPALVKSYQTVIVTVQVLLVGIFGAYGLLAPVTSVLGAFIIYSMPLILLGTLSSFPLARPFCAAAWWMLVELVLGIVPPFWIQPLLTLVDCLGISVCTVHALRLYNLGAMFTSLASASCSSLSSVATTTMTMNANSGAAAAANLMSGAGNNSTSASPFMPSSSSSSSEAAGSAQQIAMCNTAQQFSWLLGDTALIALENAGYFTALLLYKLKYLNHPEETGRRSSPLFIAMLQKFFCPALERYFSLRVFVETSSDDDDDDDDDDVATKKHRHSGNGKNKNGKNGAKSSSSSNNNNNGFFLSWKKSSGQQQQHAAKVIFGYHPHGIFAFTVPWLTMSKSWLTAAAGALPRSCVPYAANIVFNVPMMRDVAMWMGARAATKTAIVHAVSDTEVPRSPLIVPGGQAELIESRANTTTLTLVGYHLGFLRIAVQQRVPPAPIMGFGEHDIIGNVHAPKIQRFFLKRLGFPFPILPMGFAYSWLPSRVPLTACVGRPVDIEALWKNIIAKDGGAGDREKNREWPEWPAPNSPEERLLVDAVQQEYYGELRRVFHKYREAAGYKDMQLEIIMEPPSRSSGGGGACSSKTATKSETSIKK